MSEHSLTVSEIDTISGRLIKVAQGKVPKVPASEFDAEVDRIVQVYSAYGATKEVIIGFYKKRLKTIA